MVNKEYTSRPSSLSDDISLETDTFLLEKETERSRSRDPRLAIIVLSIVLIATLLNGISLFFWLSSTTKFQVAKENPILHYFLNTESGYRKPDIIERTYWDYDDDFLNDNLTIAHESWKSLFPPGEGLVALTEDEVDRIKLHPSNRAKKDPTKHIYLVGVFHQLHCLSVLRAQTIKLWKDPTYSIEDARYHHTMHCADVLRQALLCAADPNLIFKTDEIRWPGEGGSTTCRNFEAVKEWTLAHDYISSEDDEPLLGMHV